MQPRLPPTARRRQRIARFLEIAGEASTLLLGLRDQPSSRDWLALGLRCVTLGLRIQQERLSSSAEDPWSFISDALEDERIKPIPAELAPLFLRHCTDPVVDDQYYDSDGCSYRLVTATLGEESILWLHGTSSVPVRGPFVWSAREEQTYACVRKAAWDEMGCDQAWYAHGKLLADTTPQCEVELSGEAGLLRERVKRFIAAKVARSYLIYGPPGSGKSTTIQNIARSLGLRTLRVELAEGPGQQAKSSDAQAVATSLEAVVMLLAPDVLILDDLDRIEVSAELLRLLEFVRARTKVVLCSANRLEPLMGAALRPGRLDEVLRLDAVEEEARLRLVGNNAALAHRLEGLPVAYVVDFMARVRVLGEAAALAELPELKVRAQLIAEADDEEPPFVVPEARADSDDCIAANQPADPPMDGIALQTSCVARIPTAQMHAPYLRLIDTAPARSECC